MGSFSRAFVALSSVSEVRIPARREPRAYQRVHSIPVAISWRPGGSSEPTVSWKRPIEIMRSSIHSISGPRGSSEPCGQVAES
jgi:hypothetical protein